MPSLDTNLLENLEAITIPAGAERLINPILSGEDGSMIFESLLNFQ